MATDPLFPFTAGMIRRRSRPPGCRETPYTFWYPSHAPERTWREGIYDCRAAPDAPPAPGRFGLVALSHGSGGSDLNHHDWAEALARAGIAVAAPRHVGDSHDYQAGVGSRDQLLGRPRQLRHAFAAALADPLLGPHLDPDCLGAAGFSAGGYTTLILLGARPDFARWGAHCRAGNGKDILCPAGEAPETPPPSPGDWEGVAEPRLRAAALFAPFAMLFPDGELARVRAPLRLYRAGDDTVTRNPENADRVAAHAAGGVEATTEAGGHYVFIAPVGEAVAARHPLYYRDGAGVDRRALHARMAVELARFFGEAFGGCARRGERG